MSDVVITAANSITAVGHDGRITAASVRAGLSRMYIYEHFVDAMDNPITVARIRGVEDGVGDTATRLASIAATCLGEMLREYFREVRCRLPRLELIIAAASRGRPGPRYEEAALMPFSRMMERWGNLPELHVIPHGNASVPHALKLARSAIERDPGTVCIIGAVDSLIRDSTLGWLEGDGRLKSVGYGRHQGLIPGEAVSFLLVEARGRAEKRNQPVLARVAGVGTGQEPTPRASRAAGASVGLTEACRGAICGMKDNDIPAVIGDLNGESCRAKEWCIAEMRCLGADEERRLWKPAECYGDIGAASGAVAANIVAQGFLRGWVPSPVLVFCSDDHGSCGAFVLEKDPSRNG